MPHLLLVSYCEWIVQIFWFTVVDCWFFVGALWLTMGSLGMSGDKLLAYCVRDWRFENFQQSDGFLLSILSSNWLYLIFVASISLIVGCWGMISAGYKNSNLIKKIWVRVRDLSYSNGFFPFACQRSQVILAWGWRAEALHNFARIPLPPLSYHQGHHTTLLLW